jgi:D-inositol-3-phosphate glycosyltransferase
MDSKLRDKVITRTEFIPDDQVEIYFKAADVVVLPYTQIFQSGVLFLAYSFGLPAIVSDVGCLRDDLIGGDADMVFRAGDANDLGRVIESYFEGAIYANLGPYREHIREAANVRYSWTRVGEATPSVYQNVCARHE